MTIRSLLAATVLVGAAATGAQAYSGEYFVTCNLNPDGDNFLALRTCGSSKCQMIQKLGPNTFLLTMEPTSFKGWREVIVTDGIHSDNNLGAVGWVYDKYICAVEY